MVLGYNDGPRVYKDSYFRLISVSICSGSQQILQFVGLRETGKRILTIGRYAHEKVVLADNMGLQHSSSTLFCSISVLGELQD
jgi:hypothetical protein